MKLIAHRGASKEAPENTIPALYLAWQEQADGVEVDVRMTADGKAILMHDEDTLRTAGTKLEVAQQIWDAVRTLDVGAWKGPRYRATNIPLFRDVLKIIPHKRELWAEIKCGPEIIPALRNDLELRRPLESSLYFIGFSAQTMTQIKRAFPRYRAFLNVEPAGRLGAPAPWTAAHLIERAKSAALDGLSVGFCSAVDDAFIREVCDSGLGLTTWTVDEEQVAAKLARSGLPSLMTNRPAFMRKYLNGAGMA